MVAPFIDHGSSAFSVHQPSRRNTGGRMGDQTALRRRGTAPAMVVFAGRRAPAPLRIRARPRGSTRESRARTDAFEIVRSLALQASALFRGLDGHRLAHVAGSETR